jgi:5-epi-alpha-selinene synthase
VGALVRPIHLTRHLRNHAYVQTLSHLANQLVCWANDMASLGKEIAEGTTTNLVMALRHEHSLSWSEAMERAVQMWNNAMRAFVQLAGQLGDLPLSDFDRAQLEKYLVLLASWVRGNLDYDQVVRRFDALAPDADSQAAQ